MDHHDVDSIKGLFTTRLGARASGNRLETFTIGKEAGLGQLSDMLRTSEALSQEELADIKYAVRLAEPKLNDLYMVRNVAIRKSLDNERMHGWHQGFRDMLEFLDGLIAELHKRAA